jgi:hypothetical protein
MDLRNKNGILKENEDTDYIYASDSEKFSSEYTESSNSSEFLLKIS